MTEEMVVVSQEHCANCQQQPPDEWSSLSCYYCGVIPEGATE